MYMYGRVYSNSNWYDGCCDYRTEAMATDEAEYAAAADVVEGQQADMLFWFDEAVFEDSTLLLGDEGKDHHLSAATETARCLQVESNFPVEESGRISPRDLNHHIVHAEAEPVQQVQEEAKGIAVVDVPTTVLEPEQRTAPAPVVVPPENVSIEGNQSPRYTLSLLLVILIFIRFISRIVCHRHLVSGNKQQESKRAGEGARRDVDADRAEHEEEGPPQAKSFSDEGQRDVKLFVNNRALADTRKLLLEGGVVAGGGGGAKAAQLQDENDDKDKNGDSSRFGASTLTSESTSKSSVEWQSSTVTKDSETEYPFSSSSRRSSAQWESYTLFRKYDEDMVYFHRVGAQKLTETGTSTNCFFFVFLSEIKS
jgi:hypothetical protein